MSHEAHDVDTLQESGDIEVATRLQDACQQVRDEVRKAVVGQEAVIEQLLIAMLAGGHCLLEGVPGLAKTLLIRTLSDAMSLDFQRIQFTPDLMPADITGTDIIQDTADGKREMFFERGPIFAQMILADEINRTPPKTQAALLEAMQERAISIGGQTYPLDAPFFVLATQNPIEQEGTYPLPEAQRDRFLLHVQVAYPTREEEDAILDLTTSDLNSNISSVLGGEDLLEFQRVVRRVPLAPRIKRNVLDIVRSLRPSGPDAPEWAKQWIDWGPGPRASQQLVLAAKARTLLHGRYHVTHEDIATLALPVLRHRIVLSFTADSEGIRTDDVIERSVQAAVE
ncbi:MAG: MoxR family ATPase [Planctomycetota bacterium]